MNELDNYRMKKWFIKPVDVVTDHPPYAGKVWRYDGCRGGQPGSFYFTVDREGEELFESCRRFKTPETARRWCLRHLLARVKRRPARLRRSEVLA